MIQDFYALPVQAAVQPPASSVVNTKFPADVATEIKNSIEWLLNEGP